MTIVTSLREISKELIGAVNYVFTSYFPQKTELISPEVRKILAHPEDRNKYLQAIDRSSATGKVETIVLHNGDTFRIVSGFCL